MDVKLFGYQDIYSYEKVNKKLNLFLEALKRYLGKVYNFL